MTGDGKGDAPKPTGSHLIAGDKTPAAEHIASLQKKYPPRYIHSSGFDRAQLLCNMIRPVLPLQLIFQLSQQEVVVGEIGKNAPDIQYKPVPSGGYVIECNSGMIDFVEAVTYSLAGRAIGHVETGPENEMAVPIDRTIKETANLFTQWEWYKQWFWMFRKTENPDFALSPNVREWDELLSTSAELFMLCHEIGHILIEEDNLPEYQYPEGITTEEKADLIGSILLVQYANYYEKDTNFIFGAIIYAIRIIAGLEHVGIEFSNDYPKPMEKRIDNIKKFMRSLSPSEQFYHELCRIAVNYQDQMDDVEAHFSKNYHGFIPDAERLLVNQIAMLLGATCDPSVKEKMVTCIVENSKDIPAETMRQVTERLLRYYPPHSPVPPGNCYLTEERRVMMGQILQEVLAALPGPVKEMCIHHPG